MEILNELSKAAVMACAASRYDDDHDWEWQNNDRKSAGDWKQEFRDKAIRLLSRLSGRSEMEDALCEAFVIEGGEKMGDWDYECLDMTEDIDEFAERLAEAREDAVRSAISQENDDTRLALEVEGYRQEYANSMIPWRDCQPEEVSVHDILKRFGIDPNHVIARAMKLKARDDAVNRQHVPLGKRLKKDYEDAAAQRLMRGVPVIIRVSGEFSRDFTKRLSRPFDDILRLSMGKAMLELCENIQDCAFGYWQGKEISLLLIDSPASHGPWLGYDVQKLASASASMATILFNAVFADLTKKGHPEPQIFKARCFNIPESEAAGYFSCRQADAAHGSLCRMSQHVFSARELRGKDANQIQEMLLAKGLDWGKRQSPEKSGIACARKISEDGQFIMGGWKLDEEMPQMAGGIAEYLEKVLKLSMKREER